VIHLVDIIAQRASLAFKRIQGKLLLVSQQQEHLRSFQADIKETFQIESLVDLGWDSNDDQDDDNEAGETRLRSPNELYGMTLESILEYIQLDLGVFVREKWNALTEETQHELAELFSESVLKLVEEMDEIVAERDSQNEPGQELPPVMPKQVIRLRLRGFTELIEQHQLRLEGTDRGGDEITALENEYKSLRVAYGSDPVLKEAIDSIDEDTAEFDAAWQCLGAT
jgi:hypothetical protein